ncbi:MAG: hypothetical protein ACTSX9_05205 [Candidatus Njordarchaeales archaeon]
MSVFSAIALISTFLQLTSQAEDFVNFLRITKKFFANIINKTRISEAIMLWFESVEKLPSMIQISETGRDRGALSIREYYRVVDKWEVGDKIEIEGVFSRFFPLILDPDPRSLINDLKKRVQVIPKRLDDYLRELRKKGLELYSDEFQVLLNFLEFGDEFRFRTTAVIRDIPIRMHNKYGYLCALYVNKSTVNLGAIPLIVFSAQEREPKYHTFYARIYGRIAGIKTEKRPLKVIVVNEWDNVEELDRDSILYLSQWVLVKVANSDEIFPIVPRCDLANPTFYDITKQFLRNLLEVEEKIFGTKLNTVVEADMVNRIDNTINRNMGIKILKDTVKRIQ